MTWKVVVHPDLVEDMVDAGVPGDRLIVQDKLIPIEEVELGTWYGGRIWTSDSPPASGMQMPPHRLRVSAASVRACWRPGGSTA